jgi:hypothetical protein
MWRLSIFLLWRIKLATVYISLAKSFIGPFSREQSIKRAEEQKEEQKGGKDKFKTRSKATTEQSNRDQSRTEQKGSKEESEQRKQIKSRRAKE